jgi:hypothetical protein
VGSLIPESIFKDERYKSYFEKLLTWTLAGGLFGKWLESPAGLLSVSRRVWFRLTTVCCLIICLFFIFDFVIVDPKLRPEDATIWIDNTRLASPFSRPLRSIEVEIKSKDEQLRRPVTLSMGDMILAKFRPTPDWRLEYQFTIYCRASECSGRTADLELRDGKFDSAFEKETSKLSWKVREHKVLQISLSASSVANTITLLAGDYVISVSGCPQNTEQLRVPDVLTYEVVCN